MSLEFFISTLIQPKFLNLSLLICNIFMGGNFGIVNILYYSDAIDDRLLTRLDWACSVEIPKTIFDISVENCTFSREESQTTDHILQLIFVTPEILSESHDRIKKIFTFYRIFVFTTSNELNFEADWNFLKEFNFMNYSSIFLIHNSSNDTIRSYSSPNPSKGPMELHLRSVNSSSAKKAFNVAFSEKASGRLLGVTSLRDNFCESYKNNPNRFLIRKRKIIINLYFKQFNMDFINFFSFYCNTSGYIQQNVRPITRSIYSDLNLNYKPIVDVEK